MNEGRHQLPDGWGWATLGEICEHVVHVDPTRNPSKAFRYVDISSISNETFNIVNSKKYVGAKAPSRARKPIRAGDILVSTVRTYLRNVAMVPPELDGEICSTGLCVLRPIREIADSRFVFRYVLTKEFINKLTREQRGISYPAVTDRYVYAQPIPLPPLAEQKRIMAKTEELLSRIKAAKQSIQKIRFLVRRFHQFVLTKAFRGELTERDPKDEPAEKLIVRIKQERRRKWEEDLRAKGKDPKKYKYKEPEPVIAEYLPEMPRSWIWTRLGYVALVMDVDHKMPKSVKQGVPFISPKDFIGNVDVDFNNAKRIAPEDFERLSRKCKPEFGDVLISRIGTIGKVRLVPSGVQFGISYSLAILRPVQSVLDRKYLFYALQSPIIQDQARERTRSIGVPDLGLKDMNNFAFPLPSLAEQRLIVSRIDQLFAFVDDVEKSVDAASNHIEELNESILNRAFRGQLVSQDPNDEPASVLLEKIRG